jgi:hypothetical protein
VDPLLALAVIVIVVALVAAIGTPLLRPAAGNERRSRTDRLAELEARKEAKYREIRDAEGDLRAGKLSREDHLTLDRTLRREAIEILEEMDQLGRAGNGAG